MGVLEGAVRTCVRVLGKFSHSSSISKMTSLVPQRPRKALGKMPPSVCSSGVQGSQAELHTPSFATLRTWSDAYGQPKAASSQPVQEVKEASLAQQDQVKLIFGRMVAVVHSVEEAMVDMVDFQCLVRGAADAGTFGIWPFRGSNAAHCNLVTTMYYLPDIMHAASLMQRFEALFPYLESLISTSSASTLHPNKSPSLHETLSLLAEAHDLPDASEETRFRIGRLMWQWGVMRVPIDSHVGLWSSEPQPSRAGLDTKEVVLWVVGALNPKFQADRRSACDCSPSAALQLVPGPPDLPVHPGNIPQGLYTAETVKANVEKAVTLCIHRFRAFAAY